MSGTLMKGTARDRAVNETFTAAYNRLKELERSKVDLVLGTQEHTRLVVPVNDGVRGVRLLFGDTVPRVGGEEFGITDYAHGQMAARAGVTLSDYRRFRNDHPDVLAYMMNALWEREPEQRLVRTIVNGDRNVRAWLSDKYRVIDNEPFLTAALAAAEPFNVVVESATVDETRLYVKFLLPSQQAFMVGDYVQGGVIIRNSEVGDGKIEVNPWVKILRCQNGAVSMKNFSRVHLGGALDGGVQSHETQEKESAWIFSAIGDWVRFALAPENLTEMVAQFERAETVRVDATPRLAVANIVRFGGLNKGDGQAILEKYLRADSDTQFSLVNAVTEQAHERAGTYRQQVDMEELGGKLLAMEGDAFVALAKRHLTAKELENALPSITN